MFAQIKVLSFFSIFISRKVNDSPFLTFLSNSRSNNKYLGLIIDSLENGYTRYYAAKLGDKKAQAVAKILAKTIPYESENRIHRIFKYMNPEKKDRDIINLLHKDTPRGIVRFLFVYPESSQKEIEKFLKKYRATVYFYLNKLVEKDIVECISEDKKTRYKIKNEDYIFRMFYSYFAYHEKLDTKGNPTGKADYLKWYNQKYNSNLKL